MNKALSTADYTPDSAIDPQDRLPVFVLSAETCKVISLPDDKPRGTKRRDRKPPAPKLLRTVG